MSEEIEFKLREAMEARKSAAWEYEDAIVTATEAGMSNVKIGKVLGVSEAAVRIYKKRKGIK